MLAYFGKMSSHTIKYVERIPSEVVFKFIVAITCVNRYSPSCLGFQCILIAWLAALNKEIRDSDWNEYYRKVRVWISEILIYILTDRSTLRINNI